MSNTSVKEDPAEDGVWEKTFSFTVDRKDLYDLNESIRQKVVDELATYYIDDYGDKIIEILSPGGVAEHIKHHIGKVFWKNQKDD